MSYWSARTESVADVARKNVEKSSKKGRINVGLLRLSGWPYAAEDRPKNKESHTNLTPTGVLEDF